MPSPKWKLIVDLGVSAHDEVGNSSQNAQLATELLNKLTSVMPKDQRSPLAEYLPGFSSIRLLLTTPAHSDRERALFNSVIECYKTYKEAGVSDRDAIWMTARDCMLPSKHMQISQLQPPQEVKYGGLSSIAGDAVGSAQNSMDAIATSGFPAQFAEPSDPQSRARAYENQGREGASSVGNLYNFSPTLRAVAPFNHLMDPLASLAPFGLDTSQVGANELAKLLQSDPNMLFPGL